MRVQIIGGHGGVGPGHKATSYLIDGKLLIDAGSVASTLPISEQKKIDHILISHAHLDHIAELAYLCDNCFGMRDGPFEVFSHPNVIESIKKHLMNDVIWPDFSKLPSSKKPTMRFNQMIPETPFEVGTYRITPILVNHPGGACGFIIEKGKKAILFTQDTGPTEKIWEYARHCKDLKAIFSEISFPDGLQSLATESQHHTPSSFLQEIKKMPPNIPIYVGHLKPNFKNQLCKEIDRLNEKRLIVLGQDGVEFKF